MSRLKNGPLRKRAKLAYEGSCGRNAEKQQASLRLLAARTLQRGSGPGIRKLLAQLPLDTHVASTKCWTLL